MKKILIIKHGSLGDIVLALPAFAAIRSYYNKSKIYLLTEKKYFDFFMSSPYFDFYIEDNRNENLLTSFNKKIKLSREKFALIIDLQNSKRTMFYNILFRIFHSTKICSSRPFAHFRYYIPKQGVESISTGLFNQLQLIGIKKNIKENYSWLEVALKEKLTSSLALFIPGVSKSGYYKQWQPHKFSEVAKYLEKLNYQICVVGRKEDKESILPILESCKNIINKIDKSPPKIIYTLALKAKIIFSNDTGPGHIASLAKKNFIWIVNDNPISKANKPIGKHVYIIQSNSVKNISSQDVISFIGKNKLY